MTKESEGSATPPDLLTQGPVNQFRCPACVDESDKEWCDHNAAMLPLARALAVHFHEESDPADEVVGYFMDDAADLIRTVGEGPYVVRPLEVRCEWRSEHAWLINDYIVHVPSEPGAKDRVSPEVLARIPADSYSRLGGVS